MKFRFFVIAFILLILFQIKPQIGYAADPEDIKKLNFFAMVLGRGSGCGFDIKEQVDMVGNWMDRKFPPGSDDQKVYLTIFAVGFKGNFDLQFEGRSPDSCEKIRQIIFQTDWEKMCSH